MRSFTKEVLLLSPDIECFCIVPGAKEGHTSEGDRSFLKLWANIPEQTHSVNVGVVAKPRQILRDTDALITFLKDTPIGVVTADCVPILLYAPDIRAAAAVHAGWKGTLGGIVDRTLDEMERYGADISNMMVVFGPSISKEVYEVDRELGDRFAEAGFEAYVSWPDGTGGKPHVDLEGVNKERLTRRGVQAGNIYFTGECTYGNERLHSYRRDGEKAGRQLTAIVLK